MIYIPRDEKELEVVEEIVKAAIAYATSVVI